MTNQLTAGASVATVSVVTDEGPYFDREALGRLRDCLAEVCADDSIDCVLFEGGERNFCAGASAELLTAPSASDDVAQLMIETAQLVLEVPVPTIAVMSGHAVGGGLMLGLWCDIAFLADESLYGANFLDLGFTPGMGATVLAEEAFGPRLGRELLLTGRLVKGREIRNGGGAPIAHAVAPRTEVRPLALRRAAEIAALPRHAVVMVKRHLAERRGTRLMSALSEEIAMHREVLNRADTKARIATRHGGQVPA